MQSPPMAPVYWRERTFTLTELSVATDVPYDTLNQWIRLIRAIGPLEFGNRTLSRWSFDAHELYILHLVAAIYRLGHGISPDVMRAVLDFANGGGGRDGSNLIITSEDGTAHVVVDVTKLWLRTVGNCELEPADGHS